MKLNDFIKETVVQIMQGINSADSELKDLGIGNIYKESFRNTMAQTLVTLRIVKGNDEKPVLVIGFDVSVAVQEQSDSSAKVEAGVKIPLLSVISFKAGVEGESGQTNTNSNTHRITFSIPVSFK